MNSTDRQIYILCDTLDEAVTPSRRWEDEYMKSITCGSCLGPRKDYPFAPMPAYVTRIPKSPAPALIGTLPQIISDDLAALIEPYLSDVVWGPVYHESKAGLRRIAYRSYWVKHEKCLHLSRGPYGTHRLCSCGRILSTNVNAKNVTLRRYLDDRLVYGGTMDELVIDGELADRLELVKKIPFLDLWPVILIDEPMDGVALPGDPGWNGTLVERDISHLELSQKSKFYRKWAY